MRSMSDLPRDYRKARVFLHVAETIGSLGTCDRAQVGAVIVQTGRCISWGYNGAPPGMPHCSENMHGYAEMFKHLGDAQARAAETAVIQSGCRNVTHAEANAVAFAARQGISTEGATLYVGVSPCEVCARLIIAAGIEEVVFAQRYRKDEGILILLAAGVRVVG